MTGGERAHVGVATFDSQLHFYPLRRQQGQAHMLVVPDVINVYCPLPQGLLVPLLEARPMVISPAIKDCQDEAGTTCTLIWLYFVALWSLLTSSHC